jgi:hypothetical protein
LVGFFDLLIKIDRENKEREKNAITKSSWRFQGTC